MVEAAFDLHRLSEDQRIELIGEAALTQLVGVCVEKADGKADRYVEKVLKRFPAVRLVDRKPFSKDVELLRFGPAVAH